MAGRLGQATTRTWSNKSNARSSLSTAAGSSTAVTGAEGAPCSRMHRHGTCSAGDREAGMQAVAVAAVKRSGEAQHRGAMEALAMKPQVRARAACLGHYQRCAARRAGSTTRSHVHRTWCDGAWCGQRRRGRRRQCKASQRGSSRCVARALRRSSRTHSLTPSRHARATLVQQRPSVARLFKLVLQRPTHDPKRVALLRSVSLVTAPEGTLLCRQGERE